MGWLFPYGATRKSLIEERSKSWSRESNGTTVETTCLAHCYRGGSFSGVLWAVWERTFTKDGQQTSLPQRWITCDLLRCQSGEWGYKDMSEACGSYYFSCPLKYLELVPIEQHGGNAEWRELVRQHHQQQREKRKQRRLQPVS